MTEGKREEDNMKINFTDLKLGSDIWSTSTMYKIDN